MQKTEFFRLFFISRQNLDGRTIYPRIPSNELTKKGLEDNKTPRVCMSPFIEGCIRSITTSPLSLDFNIYTNINHITEQYRPSYKEVPDVDLTGEIWVREPVTLAFYGRLEIHDRVDVAPCMGMPSELTKNGFIETALFNYSVLARTSYQKGLGIEVVDQDENDDFVKNIIPTDYDAPVKDF